MADQPIAVRELSENEQKSLTNRRAEVRHPCNIDLRVSTYDGVLQPERMDYLAMESRDISTSGISFYSPKPVESEQVVLMLGDFRNPYFVTARIMRCVEGFWNRRRQYAIGCRFTGQILGPS